MMEKIVKLDSKKEEPKIKKCNNISHYLLHLLALLVGVTIGYYYHVIEEIKLKNVSLPQKEVLRSDVSIAVDDHNNLMIIDKKSGEYTIYQDSIGQSIFGMYAGKIMVNQQQ